jgi:acyl-CoA synthetase (NDP forming)
VVIGNAPRAARRGDAFPDVSRLLEPRSIAVVGASDTPGSLGGAAVRFLQKFGYPGEIWPVNPRRETVAGLRCYPTPGDLPGSADLAILAINAEAIVGVVRDCAAAGIRNGIVWAGGFAEVGGEGVARQAELVEACRETGFNLCGPNCIGIINTAIGMTASFGSSLIETDRLVTGNISMVSQSGGMATITQALAQGAGFGFRHMISSGNEAVLTSADFIHALALDADTEVIAVYLEGVRDGSRFVQALEAARAARKPVVVLKGGSTPASARAAIAHTGALAGEDRVWDAVFREHAVIRVHSQEELIDVSVLLSGSRGRALPRGNGVAAITFGGGLGVLAADQCVRHGLRTPPLDPGTTERLGDLVPPIASIANPIDVTPDAYNQAKWLELFPRALDEIAADPNVDTLLFLCGATAHKAGEIMDNVCSLRERTDKPICVAWTLPPRAVLERLPREGIYPYGELARAVRAIGHLVRYQAALDAPPRGGSATAPIDWAGFVAQPRAGTVISEHECHRILDAAGLPIAAGRLVGSADEAVGAASAVGYPVAMKGISSAVTHRAAAGLLVLDVRSDAEARDGHARLAARARELGVALDGVYVQHMVKGGLELLVSALRDPQFGVMVSLGAGGNLTETIDDVTLERAPVDAATARRMLERLRLAGATAKLDAQADPDAVAAFVAAFSELAAAAPWQRFVFEVNPIKWSREGVTAVDGLLVIEQP